MIDLGDVHRITVAVRDPDGVLADPATATLTVTLPDGTTTSPAVSLPPDATGQLVVDFATTQAGRHAWRMVTTGPATAYSDVFDVRPADPGFVVSLADAKAHLNIPTSRVEDDEELRSFIEATTAVVERYAGAVLRASHTQTSDGGRDAVVLAHTPVLSVTSVTESGATVAASGYDLDEDSGVLTRMSGRYRRCWLDGAANIAVTYTAGRQVIPANISRAALIILKHMWETQRAAGGSRPALGGEVADPATYVVNPSAYAIPYRALELLGEPVSGIA
jgi:uncharacterized phiE125 gp8 family phage protein